MVDVIGYSLPATDVVSTGMLGERLSGREVTVRVVNPYPAAPLAALEGIAVAAEPLTAGLESYVNSWEAEVGSAAWLELDALPADLPVLVGSHPVNLRVVVPDMEGPTAEPCSGPATRSRDPEEVVPLSVADIRALRREPNEPLRIRHDAEKQVVIGWETFPVDTGHRTLWAVAVTAHQTQAPDDYY